MNTVITWAHLLIFLVLAYSGHIFADEVRPAYLEISEKGTRMLPLMPKYYGNSQLFRIEDSRSIRFSKNPVT